jgi:hypothetical protein
VRLTRRSTIIGVLLLTRTSQPVCAAVTGLFKCSCRQMEERAAKQRICAGPPRRTSTLFAVE